jgi:uncharacterized glyoxalase superfamily protein PhnB
MPAEPKETVSTIMPALRYRDAAAAIDWLCRAFGFQRHLVVPDENGKIAHAQLSFGRGMVMLGSDHEGAYDKLLRHPAEIGQRVTQAPYVIVADPDAHYRQAKAAGAEMVMEIADMDYGGRAYSCRDLEGHVWNFGSYDPWTDK